MNLSGSRMSGTDAADAESCGQCIRTTASIARRWIRQAVEQAMPEKGIIPIARVFIQFWGCLEFERTTATIWYHIV